MNLVSPPKKWHVYIVNLEPRVGTKPGKQRPCISIQPDEFGVMGLKSTVVLPITTKITKEAAYPLRVRLSKGTCGLDKESDVIVDQILAWDNELFKEDLGAVPTAIKMKIEDALRDFLELS